ncbi:hypothetical protein JTB14_034557 [Gonioctena quinquepunctata]|nr:hypothetical protein JTB14_034557 [Gonioctena quinquepunctata]
MFRDGVISVLSMVRFISSNLIESRVDLEKSLEHLRYLIEGTTDTRKDRLKQAFPPFGLNIDRNEDLKIEQAQQWISSNDLIVNERETGFLNFDRRPMEPINEMNYGSVKFLGIQIDCDCGHRYSMYQTIYLQIALQKAAIRCIIQGRYYKLQYIVTNGLQKN